MNKAFCQQKRVKRLLIVILVSALTVSTSGHSPETPVVKRGQRWLAEVQNADGSWGDEPNRLYLTLVTTLAFLNLGEVPSADREAARTCSRALSWLKEQRATNDLEMALLLHVFTAAARLEGDPKLAEHVRMLSSIVDRGRMQGVSLVLVQIRAPVGASANDLTGTDEPLRSLQPLPTDPIQLVEYLRSLLLFIQSGRQWEIYSRDVLRPLFLRQLSSGAFSDEQGSPSIETTTFVLLRIGIYLRYWLDYLDVGPLRAEPPSTTEVEVTID